MTRAKLTYSGTTGLAATPLLVVGCSSDGRLTHAEVEARAIAESFDDAILLTGHAATHESFMRWAGGADVIYIASHGAYRADGLQFSYLELADGRLEAREVIEMRLQASAVIVSACETAVGRLTGNEVMGLVRAFLYAGARSVLATHWKVDDAATAQLMTRFARELRRGISVAQSLTAAQRAVIREEDYALIAHPFYWGAHSFVGVDGVRSAQGAQ